MKFKEIVSISGMSGLYQLKATKSDGAIVKNLEDDVTKFVAARSHNVTPLDSIEVYTQSSNVKLFEVFQLFKTKESIFENLEINKTDNKKIVQIFTDLFPDYDKDRVYASDMKKMLKWYGILKKLDLLNEEISDEKEEASIVEEEMTTPEVTKEE